MRHKHCKVLCSCTYYKLWILWKIEGSVWYGKLKVAWYRVVVYIVATLYPQFSHSWSQPTLDQIYCGESWPGWLSWLDLHSIHQRVAGFIPSQDTYIDCGFSPPLGCLWEATNRCFSITSVFLSPFLSLKSVTIALGGNFKNTYIVGENPQKFQKAKLEFAIC